MVDPQLFGQRDATTVINTKKVKASDIRNVVNSKKSLYDAVVANRIYVPPLNDAFISFKFLEKVRTQKAWLPFSYNLRTYSCVDPPNKELVASHLIDEMQKFRSKENPPHTPEVQMAIDRTIRRIQKAPPAKTYLLTLLFNLNPTHLIFTKGYQKPKKQRMGMQEEIEVEVANDFFDGLPQAKAVKRSTVPGMTGRKKLLQKQKAMQSAMKYYKKKIEEAKQKYQDMESSSDISEDLSDEVSIPSINSNGQGSSDAQDVSEEAHSDYEDEQQSKSKIMGSGKQKPKPNPKQTQQTQQTKQVDQVEKQKLPDFKQMADNFDMLELNFLPNNTAQPEQIPNFGIQNQNQSSRRSMGGQLDPTTNGDVDMIDEYRQQKAATSSEKSQKSTKKRITKRKIEATMITPYKHVSRRREAQKIDGSKTKKE